MSKPPRWKINRAAPKCRVIHCRLGAVEADWLAQEAALEETTSSEILRLALKHYREHVLGLDPLEAAPVTAPEPAPLRWFGLLHPAFSRARPCIIPPRPLGLLGPFGDGSVIVEADIKETREQAIARVFEGRPRPSGRVQLVVRGGVLKAWKEARNGDADASQAPEPVVA